MDKKDRGLSDNFTDEQNFLRPLMNLLTKTPETPFFIDLTDDNEEEPVVKKIALTEHVVERSPAGSSRAVNGAWNAKPTSVKAYDQQPSTSRQKPKPQRDGICSKCGDEQSKVTQLRCDHRLCYKCLIVNLRSNESIQNVCSILRCKQLIPDSVIKAALLRDDYVFYLEHFNNNLRYALQIRSLGTGDGILNGLPTATTINGTEGAVDLEDLPELTDLGSLVGEVEARQESTREVVKCQEVMEIESLVQAAVQAHSSNEWQHLTNLDAESFVQNGEPFDCPICFSLVRIGEGVILKNCLHSFCIECLSETIKHADEPQVTCPYNSELGSCEFLIQEREIRALVSPEIHEKYLATALKRAETNMQNIFHCKSLDCVGFVEHEHDRIAFNCTVCEKVNCIPCKAIHEDKTCEQYQESLLTSTRTREEEQMTEAELKKRIEDGNVSEYVYYFPSLFIKGIFSFSRQCYARNVKPLLRKMRAVTSSCAFHASSVFATEQRSPDCRSPKQLMELKLSSTVVIAVKEKKESAIRIAPTVTETCSPPANLCSLFSPYNTNLIKYFSISNLLLFFDQMSE